MGKTGTITGGRDGAVLQVFAEDAIELDGAKVALLFWCLDSKQMCNFFNALGGQSRAGGRIDFQMQHVVDEELLTSDGRYAMRSMGEYADAPTTRSEYPDKEESNG